MDNIATGAGNDRLISGFVGAINPDELSGGPGDDEFHVRGILQAPGALQPGGPHNRLYASISGDTVIDLPARAVTIDGRSVLTWHAGRIDHITTVPGHLVESGGTLTFTGTRGADVLSLAGSSFVANPRVVARLRGGDDTLEARSDGFAADSTFTAGRGHDSLLVNLRESGGKHPSTGDDDVAIDLAAHTLHARGAVVTNAVIRGFDGVQAGGSLSLVVRGDQGANAVLAVGCRVQVDGRGGDDVLRTVSPVPCQAGRRYLGGGPGDDLVIGGELADVLVGGPGQDIANGRGGDDRCSAETARTCEHQFGQVTQPWHAARLSGLNKNASTDITTSAHHPQAGTFEGPARRSATTPRRSAS